MAETGIGAARDLAGLLRARNPLIWIVTKEEARAERLIVEACAAAAYRPIAWDCTLGITDPITGSPIPSMQGGEDPGECLRRIRGSTERSAWILRDLPAFLRDPFVSRGVRTLARTLPAEPRDRARSLIVVSPSAEVPADLAGHAVVIEWPLPDRAEVAGLLDAALAALPESARPGALRPGDRDRAIDAAVGLTETAAAAAFSRSLVQTSRKPDAGGEGAPRIDPAIVAAEKRREVGAGGLLTWYDPDPRGLDSIGGLDALKAWLRARSAAFSPEARAYGLPRPRGVLLVGPPGTGKSLGAKAIPAAWGLPLLRLDLGRLRSKYVGESEANMRAALRLAETVAPCVLWIDEVEKALAGSTGLQGDGGVGADALGALLTFAQESRAGVFMVATANDARSLPPELTRAGRFDAIWFVDLPTAAERAEIVRVSLAASGRGSDIAGADLSPIVTSTAGFTGAEIAAIVPDAMFAAFEDGRRPLAVGDLVAAAARVVPVSRSAGEKLADLRQWAQGRARLASTPEQQTTSKKGAAALDL